VKAERHQLAIWDGNYACAPTDLRHPIIGLVSLNADRTTAPRSRRIETVSRSEIASSDHPVHMGPLRIRVDDRVELFGDERVDLVEMPSTCRDGSDRRGCESRQEEKNGRGCEVLEEHVERSFQ
jgi:hypothetical protein